MNDDEKELVKVGFESAFKPFANLAERLFGGAVDQIGGGWEDRLKLRRQLRQIKLFTKLKKKIDEAGFDPRGIPDVVWMPALQQASLEDDGTLQETWANLLANAADPRNTHPFETCFTEMLRNLSAREVKFLDGLFNDKRPYKINDRRLHLIYREAGLARMAEPPSMPHYATKIILHDADEREFDLMMDILKRETILVSNAEGLTGKDRFTRLGFAFVQACQKPEGFGGVLVAAQK